MCAQKKTVIHWFRKGLRVHDNPALNAAIRMVRENDNLVLRTIYIDDPEIKEFVRIGPNRKRFLQQSLTQLDEKLRSLGLR